MESKTELPAVTAPTPSPVSSDPVLDEIVAELKKSEGLSLVAYPDPYWKGVKRTEANWSEWGKPWTIGYGETKGIKEGMVWTREYAEDVVRKRAAYFYLQTMSKCPQLIKEPSGRRVACTSLAYNIGIGAFGASSVARHTKALAYVAASKAFLLWNKAKGKVLRGLTIRRKHESEIYMRGW